LLQFDLYLFASIESSCPFDQEHRQVQASAAESVAVR
jgi:hypothetical protein